MGFLEGFYFGLGLWLSTSLIFSALVLLTSIIKNYGKKKTGSQKTGEQKAK